jgi:hypothetical protein
MQTSNRVFALIPGSLVWPKTLADRGGNGAQLRYIEAFNFAASDVARPDPRRRLILAHLEDAPGRLDHEPGAVQTFSAAWRVAGAVVN